MNIFDWDMLDDLELFKGANYYFWPLGIKQFSVKWQISFGDIWKLFETNPNTNICCLLEQKFLEFFILVETMT